MAQPLWNCVANLGDVNALEHGGRFVVVDALGNYDPEVWIIYPNDEKTEWTKVTICVDRCFVGTKGLNDNHYHAGLTTWWYDKLDDICSSNDISRDLLSGYFVGSSVNARALAYGMLYDYFGAQEFGDVDKYDKEKITVIIDMLNENMKNTYVKVQRRNMLM
jgi:signal peptidase I